MAEENKNMPTVDGQYQRLIDARNFHYNNLNKWLMSFYAIIAALFLALYTLHKEGGAYLYMELCTAIVGYVVSIAAFLSGKGYYYWETNWIMLVHHYEKTYLKEIVKANGDDMRVYSVFANKKVNNNLCFLTTGANISTTKVALAITGFIMCLWGMIGIYMCINLLPSCISNCPTWSKMLFSFFASIVLTQCMVRFGGKNLESDMKPLDDLCINENNQDKSIKLEK